MLGIHNGLPASFKLVQGQAQATRSASLHSLLSRVVRVPSSPEVACLRSGTSGSYLACRKALLTCYHAVESLLR